MPLSPETKSQITQLAGRSDWPGMEVLYRAHIAQHPEDVVGHLGLGFVLMKQKRFDEAEQACPSETLRDKK